MRSKFQLAIRKRGPKIGQYSVRRTIAAKMPKIRIPKGYKGLGKLKL